MMKEFLRLSVLLIGPLKTIIARGCQRWSSNSISDALTWQFISVVTMSLDKLLLSSWCLSTMRPNIWTLKVYFFYFCSLFFVWVEIIISAVDFRSKCLSATPNHHPRPHSPSSSSHPSRKTVTKSTNNSFREGCCYDWSMLDAYSTSLYLQVWQEFLKLIFHDCDAHEPTAVLKIYFRFF